ncbi:MAG: hypothetical protein JWM85_2601 [Acidimicrobiaceae bacterium]|nr:hypothetical protein [Acidimicrobiaceae bacterium]
MGALVPGKHEATPGWRSARLSATSWRSLAVGVALVGTALGATSCSVAADNASGVKSWASQASYGSSTTLLKQDLQEISTGIRLKKLLATKTACDGLGADAGTAVGQLPTPDTRFTNELSAAYNDLVNAAQSCSTASSFSSSAFRRYRSGAAAASRLLAQAARRFSELGG